MNTLQGVTMILRIVVDTADDVLRHVDVEVLHILGQDLDRVHEAGK